jgi:hypothetical protein
MGLRSTFLTFFVSTMAAVRRQYRFDDTLRPLTCRHYLRGSPRHGHPTNQDSSPRRRHSGRQRQTEADPGRVFSRTAVFRARHQAHDVELEDEVVPRISRVLKTKRSLKTITIKLKIYLFIKKLLKNITFHFN